MKLAFVEIRGYQKQEAEFRRCRQRGQVYLSKTTGKRRTTFRFDSIMTTNDLNQPAIDALRAAWHASLRLARVKRVSVAGCWSATGSTAGTFVLPTVTAHIVEQGFLAILSASANWDDIDARRKAKHEE